MENKNIGNRSSNSIRLKKCAKNNLLIFIDSYKRKYIRRVLKCTKYEDIAELIIIDYTKNRRFCIFKILYVMETTE